MKIVFTLLVLCLLVVPASGADVDWNFDKRVSTLEKEVAQLKADIAALKGGGGVKSGPTTSAPAQTGSWVTSCEDGKCRRVWVPAPPAFKPTQVLPNGSFVPAMSFQPLPAGFRWEKTAAGHGLVGPDGQWYVQPSAENTTRLDSGYWYVPMPETTPFPHGYWGSPCTKDENCKVISCDIPPVGQHGEPTSPSAQTTATARDNAFHPNQYPTGIRRVLATGGCATGNCGTVTQSVGWSFCPCGPGGPAGNCGSGQCPANGGRGGCPCANAVSRPYGDFCAQNTPSPVIYPSGGAFWAQKSSQGLFRASYGTGDNHTHTCPSCGTTWGGPGHGHNCPNCGTVVTMQDGGGRYAAPFRPAAGGPVRRLIARIRNR